MNLKETFFPKIFIFAAVLCFLCGTATAQTVTIAKTFTESSSWEIPAGVTSVTIECVGGGGAGGYVHGEGQLFRNSGGGGGGAYARKVQDVSPGQTLYITVGAGGYAWASDGNQVNGGSSEVSINSVFQVLRNLLLTRLKLQVAKPLKAPTLLPVHLVVQLATV